MKQFIKVSLVVATGWAVVVGMALSASSCEHKPDVTPVDTTTVVSKPTGQWTTVKDFLSWVNDEADENYCDSIIFKVMAPEDLYNVTTVVSSKNESFTKKDIVREFLDRKDVYSALRKKTTVDSVVCDTKDTIIDGVKVQLINTSRYE